jgi:Acetyltransferase (GNAT) domain
MANAWVIQPTQLRYLLGEVQLFSVSFPSLVLDAHFTELGTDSNNPRPPLEKLGPEVEAAVTLAHPVKSDLPRFTFLPQGIRYVPFKYSRHFVRRDGSFADYLAAFPAKARSTLLRKVRRFKEFSAGSVCWHEYRGSAEISEFHRVALEVAQKSWQARRLSAWGVRDDSEFRRELADLAACDSARGYILFHGEKPITYIYCPSRDDILFYRFVGYDPEFEMWSPGIVLLYLVLENFFTEGRFRLFDFCEGAGQHKELFSTGNVFCADIFYFRQTLRNVSLLILHSGFSILSRTVVATLRFFGWKGRAKKFFRRKL